MSESIRSMRGMHDLLPKHTPKWQWLTNHLQYLCQSYAYREIRLPILEYTALFQRSVGLYSDIVGKEMYTFHDHDKRSVSLRPEGTAGCVRACIQHGLVYKQTQRLYYLGPMFRHERPQKGRYRQFWQFGLEALGMPDPDIEAEQLLFTARLWDRLGLQGKLILQLHSIGNADERARFAEALTTYFKPHAHTWSAIDQQRLAHNPLRLLDSKHPALQELIQDTPLLHDYLGEKSLQHFQKVCQHLKDAQIDYQINPRLVRGLDYYNATVFEWVSDTDHTQNTICAGGRYDDLVAQLNGPPTPAFGCSIGLERLLDLIDETHRDTDVPHLYWISLGETASDAGLKLTETLRCALPHLRIMRHSGHHHSLKQQMKRADQSGAIYACILGDDEWKKQIVSIKWLRQKRPQQTVPLEQLVDYFQTQLQDTTHENNTP